MATRTRLVLEGENRTQRAFREVDRSLGRLGQSVGRLSGLLAGGLFARAAVDAARFADRIGKLNDRLGASTQFLSQMRFAAEQTGVTFDTFATALQRLQRRVSEAANGTGEAAGALRELGLNAQRLEQLSLEDQFDLIAEAIDQLGSDADKTRIAMRLFDTEGVALLQTMQGGAEAVRALRDEADRLGATIDEETTQRAANAADAINRMQTAFNALARELAVNVAPSLTAVANFLAGPFQEVAVLLQSALLKVVSVVTTALGQLLQAASNTLDRIKRGLDAFFLPSEAVSKAADALRGYGDALAQVGGTAGDAAANKAREYTLLLGGIERQAGATRTALDELFGQAGTGNQDNVVRGQVPGLLGEFVRNTSKRLKDIGAGDGTGGGEGAGPLADFSRSVSDALTQGVVNAGDGMRQAFAAILADLAQQLLASSLFQAFSGIGSFFGFGGGGGVSGRQAGGFAGPGIYRVGEAGPETVAIGQGAMVYANRMAAGGGGLTINQQVDARGADAAAAARVERAIRLSQRETLAIVKDMRKRGRL